MTEKQEIITDDEFKKIFSCRRVRELLLMDIAAYPIIYHFMNYFMVNRLSKKREYVPSKKHLSFIKFNDINRLMKTSFFHIKSFLEKNETLKIGLDILFFSRDRFIEINTEDGKIKSDYLFWSVIHEINKKHPDCKMVMICTNDKSMPQIDDIRLYSLIQYSTPMIFLRSILFGTVIYLKWKLSRSKINMYLKDNHCECTVSLFDDFFSLIRLVFLLIRDYSLQNLLTKTNPKVIMANNDVLQLKPNNLENTKFIIMQSASIDAMIEKYKGMFLSTFPLDKLIADYFLVSGPKFKDMKKDAKDSEEIIVTGQPRYDIIYEADKIYDKNKICKQLNLDQNKKMILWTTQTHGSPIDENEKNISAVFNAVKSLKNVQLVIKLHPAEDQKASLYKKDKSFEPVIIGRNADTQALLFISDLLITRHSATAMEAIALNKPVIILNLSGEPDPVEYVKEAVALGVYKEEDLTPAFEKLLKDDSELAKNRAAHIEKNLYKIDGKATERVVNLIEELIKSPRRETMKNKIMIKNRH